MKILIFSCLFLIVQCPIWAIDINSTIQSNAITRSFALHAQGTSVAQNLPVLLVLHGDGGSGSYMKNSTNFDAIADANNFVAVYPSSTAQLGAGIWNKPIDGDYAGEPDDVLFISDLIDHLCVTYKINPNKVYVTGHSGGAFMAYHLAVMLHSKIAAFAPVAGSMYDVNGGTFLSNYLSGASFVKVPICHIHGDADAVVSYPNPNHAPDAYQEWPLTGFSPVTCGSTTYTPANITTIVTNVQRIPFCENGANSKEVVLIRLIGKGHEWPNVVGFNVEQFIWDFCNNYQLSTGISCNTVSLNEFSDEIKMNVFPNPISTDLTVELFESESEIQIIDINGEILLSQRGIKGDNIVNVSSLSSAVYFVKVITSGGKTSLQRIVKF